MTSRHPRHPRRSAEQWEALVTEYHESHDTKSQFCATRDISESSLQKWCYKLGAAEARPTKRRSINGAGFEPINISPAQTHQSDIHIELPGGVHIHCNHCNSLPPADYLQQLCRGVTSGR